MDDVVREGLPVERQVELTCHWDWMTRLRLARLPDLCETAQGALAGDATLDVRLALAGNPALGARVQEMLLSDRDGVVTALASNPQVTPSVQVALSYGSSRVLRALAKNQSLDREVQVSLSWSEDVLVVLNLWKNSSLVLDEHMPLRFVDQFDPKFVKRYCKTALDPSEYEVVKALRGEWQGDLVSLMGAARLVNR